MVYINNIKVNNTRGRVMIPDRPALVNEDSTPEFDQYAISLLSGGRTENELNKLRSRALKAILKKRSAAPSEAKWLDDIVSYHRTHNDPSMTRKRALELELMQIYMGINYEERK